MKRSISNLPNNIVVTNTTHIGTLLCNYPLLLRLKKKYPTANITVLLSKRNGVLKKFLERQAFSVIVLDNNFLGISRYKTITEALLGKFGHYDLAICGLEPRKTDHLLLRALSNNCMAYGEDNWHSKLIKHLVNFERSAYEEITQAQFSVNVFDGSSIDMSEWPRLKKEKKPFENLTLLVQSENNRANSILSPVKLSAILNRAFREIPFDLVINSSKPNEYTSSLLQLLDFSSCKVKVTKDFEDFVDLVNNVDVCLLGDGGASHISAFTETPALVLFGETSVTHWKPMSTNQEILSDQVTVENISDSEILEKLLKLFHETLKKRTLMLKK